MQNSSQKKKILYGEIQHLKEQLLQQKSLSQQYKPDFVEASELMKFNGSLDIDLNKKNEQQLAQQQQINQRLKHQASFSLKENEKLKMESYKLQQEMFEVNAKMTEYDKLKEQYDDNMKTINEQTQQNEELKKQIEQLHSENEQLQNQYNDTLQQNEKMKNELKKLVNTKSSDESNLQKTTEKLQKIAAQAAEYQAQVARLNSQLQKAEERAKNSEDDACNSRRQSMQYEKDIQHLQQDIEGIKNDRIELQTQLDELKNQQEDDGGDSNSEKIKQKMQQMMAEKQKQLEEYKHHIVQLESDTFRKITGLKAQQNDTIQSLVEKYQESLKNLEKQKIAQAKINKAMNKMKSSSTSQSQNASAEFETHQLDQPNEIQFDPKTDLRKCSAKVQQQFSQMQKQIELNQSDLDSKNVIINQQQQEIDELAQKLNSPEVQQSMQIQSSRDRLNALKQEIEQQNEMFQQQSTNANQPLTEEQITNTVNQQQKLIDEFNAQLNVLAKFDIGQIEHLQMMIEKSQNIEKKQLKKADSGIFGFMSEKSKKDDTQQQQQSGSSNYNCNSNSNSNNNNNYISNNDNNSNNYSSNNNITNSNNNNMNSSNHNNINNDNINNNSIGTISDYQHQPTAESKRSQLGLSASLDLSMNELNQMQYEDKQTQTEEQKYTPQQDTNIEKPVIPQLHIQNRSQSQANNNNQYFARFQRKPLYNNADATNLSSYQQYNQIDMKNLLAKLKQQQNISNSNKNKEIITNSLAHSNSVGTVHKKWSHQLEKINRMLAANNLPLIRQTDNLSKSLSDRKTQIIDYYQKQRLGYDKNAVIKQMKNEENHLDSMMVISDGKTRKFYTFLGTKLVRTLGSKEEEKQCVNLKRSSKNLPSINIH